MLGISVAYSFSHKMSSMKRLCNALNCTNPSFYADYLFTHKDIAKEEQKKWLKFKIGSPIAVN